MKHVYRIGDRVRIVNPKFVLRVGYPQTAGDLFKGFRDHPKLHEAAVLLGIIPERGELPHRVANEFASGAALAANRYQGFGGKQRSIHYYAEPTAESYTSEIYRKRVVQTGTYYPPAGGGGGWDDYWYEPGGLDDRKTHVLLLVDGGEIEACNVEPVAP